MNRERGLYAIYDRAGLQHDALDRVAAALAGGARWLQYRDKRSVAPDRRLVAELLALTQQFDARLIINDDWRLAADCGADGVHLGQRDGDVAAARSALGAAATIGVSCSARLDLARAAIAAGADHVSFGRFFDSRTKPDAPPAPLSILTDARGLGVPVVAIGGINADNAVRIIAAGADRIAVAGALFAADDTAAAARRLSALFE